MNLNLVAAVNGSGYGVVGLNVLKALTRAGCDVAFFSRYVRGPDLPLELDEVSLVMRCLRAQRTVDMAAPCLRISAEDDMTLFAGRGPRGGLAFFETTVFTDVELRHVRALDVFFVASEWGRQVAIANGLEPAAVVTAPMGVDRAVFAEAEPTRGDRTAFLHIGAWQHRKGQDAILDAFAKAFRPGDPVELRMLCDNPWAAIGEERWRDECRASPMAERITILERAASHRDLATLMHDADCGVFPARGEAWNLEVLEMMSCGRQLDQLVEHLRAIHVRKQSGEILRNDAGIATAERYSWVHTAECLVNGYA